MAEDRDFIILQPDQLAKPAEIHVVVNWFEELKRLPAR